MAVKLRRALKNAIEKAQKLANESGKTQIIQAEGDMSLQIYDKNNRYEFAEIIAEVSPDLKRHKWYASALVKNWQKCECGAERRKDKNGQFYYQAESEKSGVSPSTLSRIENGIGTPDAGNIAQIAKWLDMPIDRIMKNEGKENLITYYPHESTPEIVEAHVSADESIHPALRQELAQVFRETYLRYESISEKLFDLGFQSDI